MEENNIGNIMRISLIGLVVIVMNVVNKTTEYDSLFIYISMGLLTFVGVFYSLILRTDIQDKSKRLVIHKWEGIVPQFSKKLESIKLISKDIKKSPQSYKLMLNELNEIQYIFTEFGVYYDELNLHKKLNYTVSGLLFSILMFLFHVILSDLQSLTQYINLFGVLASGSFVFGIYYLIEIIIAWHRITLKE